MTITIGKKMLALCLSFHFSGIASADIVVSDSTFDDVDWQHVNVMNTTNHWSGPFEQDGSRGNAPPSMVGAHRQAKGTVIYWHHFLPGTYDPARNGPVATIGLALDARVHSVSSGCERAPEVAFGLMIVQNNRPFMAIGEAVIPSDGWKRTDIGGALQETDFGLTGPGGTVDYNQNPDFSEQGAPIELGFYSRAYWDSNVESCTREWGVDNFLVRIDSPCYVENGPHLGLIEVTEVARDICLADLPENPVLILGPPSANGNGAGVARIRRSASASDFQAWFQEWDYEDDVHGKEVFSYLVLPVGRHEMPDGSTWEVGKFSLDGTKNWLPIQFSEPFSKRPYLFLTPQTDNEYDPVSVRARAVDETGFEAALFEEELLMDGHAAEEIGYVAIHHPTRLTTPEVNGLGGMATINSRNIPYYAQRLSVDQNFKEFVGVSLKLEEEKSQDDETWHVLEEVDVLTIGGQVFAQQVTSNGSDPAALRRNKRDKE